MQYSRSAWKAIKLVNSSSFACAKRYSGTSLASHDQLPYSCDKLTPVTMIAQRLLLFRLASSFDILQFRRRISNSFFSCEANYEWLFVRHTFEQFLFGAQVIRNTRQRRSRCRSCILYIPSRAQFIGPSAITKAARKGSICRCVRCPGKDPGEVQGGEVGDREQAKSLELWIDVAAGSE